MIENITIIHRINDNIEINLNQNISCNYNILYKKDYDYCKEFILTSKQLNNMNKINKCYINNENHCVYNVETIENMKTAEFNTYLELYSLIILKYLLHIYILLLIILKIKNKIDEIDKLIIINRSLLPNTECIISYNIIKNNTYYYKCERCVAIYEWSSYIEYINYRKYKCAYCSQKFNLKIAYLNK